MHNYKKVKQGFFSLSALTAPKKKITKAVSIAITTIVVSSHYSVFAVPWQIEKKGLGSISLEPVGTGLYNWQPALRSTKLPQSIIYKTDNIDKTQTNDWASSVVFNQYSEALYAHPAAYMATSEGFEISNPPLTSARDGDNMGEKSVLRIHEGNADIVIKASTFSPVDARADKISDWAYDILMANGNKSVKATIAHGSPYSFYEFIGAQPQVALKRGTSMTVIGNTSGRSL